MLHANAKYAIKRHGHQCFWLNMSYCLQTWYFLVIIILAVLFLCDTRIYCTRHENIQLVLRTHSEFSWLMQYILISHSKSSNYIILLVKSTQTCIGGKYCVVYFLFQIFSEFYIHKKYFKVIVRNNSLVDHQCCHLQSLSFILLNMSTPL